MEGNIGIGVEETFGIGVSAVGVGAPVENTEEQISEVIATADISVPTVETILSQFKSGIGLDIAKNHTGVCLWRDGKVETLGFAIEMEYEKDSYMAEAKMRLEFKSKLEEILKGYDWEVCIIEDVYGGVNFDTTRKLLALNCVVDELMLEGRVTIGNLYRFKEAEWIKDLRSIVKLGTKLNPKYECQKILEYLGYQFVLENYNRSESYKQDIFFEDRCDATGQLLALAMHLKSEVRTVKKSSLRLSDIYMVFIEDLDDAFYLDDETVGSYGINEVVDFNRKDIERGILDAVEENKNQVYFVMLSTGELGTFGMKNGLTFYEQGFGYLIFYHKSLRKL